MRHHLRRLALLWPVLAGACGSDPGNSPPATDLSSCTAATTTPISLTVGESRTIDVSQQGNCIVLPGAGSAQEYVVVAYSGYGVSNSGGTSAQYALQSIIGSPTASAFMANLGASGGLLVAAPTPSNPAQFELNLRRAERALAMSPLRQRGAVVLPPAAPPAIGDRDSFNVCATTSCSSFNRIGATVKYAGSPGVIYVDDHQLSGAEVLGPDDIQQLGGLFDNYLYAADTTAFGRESDVNNDQHIAILVTPAVNNLTSDCTNGRIIGYTFSNDLVPLARGSNAREMFYTMTTAPATQKCKAVTRTSALTALPPTLIHELQHMISFNQHVLLRNGNDQDVWLNEGLSHFAEELGWRTVPASQCGDCFSSFAGGDVSNAFAYLNNPEAQYLIAPESTDGTLAERGAAWLFLRWVADHFSADTLLGTQFTRAMEQTSVIGAQRVSQVTGVDFPILVGEWQMANWTDDLPGFPQDGLLDYRTWNFRSVFAANFPAVFSKVFPLTPDSTAGVYVHPGVLLAGSGRTVRYRLAAGSSGVTIRMAGTTGGAALTATIVPWLAVVRVQ